MEDLAMTLMRKQNSMFPSFFDNFFSKELMDWNNFNFSNTNTTIPAVNVKETEEKFEIEVAVPGMKKDDFKVKLENNLLTISSEMKEEKNEENKNYSRREFSYQSFVRSFSLPEMLVDQDKIEAVYTDGILKIALPKREEAKPKPVREIAIS